MFDLDAGKLIVIGIVALIAIPSKDLPRVLRQLGQMTGRMRRMAAEFQGQFMEAMRESELHELKAEIDKVEESVQLNGSFNPLDAARKQINSALEAQPLEARERKAPSQETGAEDASSKDAGARNAGA